ncbi:MAG: hypothetical protein HWN68_19805, partial [Desulfobacterales bacterium]|nr:hypothetical protein [Desulfobacterales bacterium]
HYVHGFYEETLLWVGGPEGLLRAAIFKRDAAGIPLYSICPGPSWSGEQTMQKTKGDDYWEDIWIIQDPEPVSVTVAHGDIKVRWDRFDSTWTVYLKTIEDGLYMERKAAREGAKEPFTDAPGCYQVAFKAIWS